MVSETVVAILTPSGTGAIATLALHGPNAWDIARPLFRPISRNVPESIETVDPGDFWLGRLGEEISDEVVFTLKQAQPVPWVEIHCHGGIQIQNVLRELLQSKGATPVPWQDFLRRITPSRLCAAATIALTKAPTVRTASILLDQVHGALERELQAIAQMLKDDQPQVAEARLTALCHTAEVGRHLVEPWKVVIAGAPNVGKSSLVNALAGYQRAVVSEIPGTTRDVVTTRLALDGWPVEVSDTAGIRETEEKLELAGMKLAMERINKADLCLWVVEATSEPLWPKEIKTPTLLIVNKTDLEPVWNVEEDLIRVSAKTGAGMEKVCQRIIEQCLPEAPEPGAPVAFDEELIQAINLAREHCQAGDFQAARTLLESWLRT